MTQKIWASESVTEGHPDKLADLISDTVLDYVLEQDPNGRVACETFLPGKEVIIGGEITTEANLDNGVIDKVRENIKKVGYTPDISPDFNNFSRIRWLVKKQSKDISQGVDIGGAGDQGFMIGYATNETHELMPFPILLAHKLTRRLSEARKKRILPFLRPDGKSQVSVVYENGKPYCVSHITIAAQHSEEVSDNDLNEGIIEEVINKIINQNGLWLFSQKKFPSITINGTGRFVKGGPEGDTGLTGRKIVVDSYGGMAPNGGGAFSGKDPTKVDRSAAYMARHIAKNIVAAGLADRFQVHLAYEIGKIDPTAINIETFGTSKLSDEDLERIVRTEFPLHPMHCGQKDIEGIIEYLDLRKPIFSRTTNYGHFGREDEGFKWENTDKAEKLKGYLPEKPKFFPYEFED